MTRKTMSYILVILIILVSGNYVFRRATSFHAARQAERAAAARVHLSLITNEVYYAGANLVAAVHVQDLDWQPVEANIHVSLQDNYASFETNTSGTGVINLPLLGVENGQQRLDITVETRNNSQNFSQQVYITPHADQTLIIHFDKGLYKPGDDVLFRILALHSNNAHPFAGGLYTVSIFDGNDNRVYHADAQTSDFGIISGRFWIAEEVNSGLYRLVVERDGAFVTQSFFEVAPFVLPQFEISLETNRAEFIVGETMYLTGNVQYFFGEPVNQGIVNIHINGEPNLVSAELDENGNFSFSYDIETPGLINIFVEVIDNSNYRVEQTLAIRASEGAFTIELMAEHGYLVRGMPNAVYIFTNRTDDTPIRADLQISGPTFSSRVTTDDDGIGKFILDEVRDVNHISVTGMDSDHNTSTSEFTIPGVTRDVTLSTNRPRYNMSETIYLTLYRREWLNNQEDDGIFLIYAYRNEQLLQILTTPYNHAELYLGDNYGLIDIYATWFSHSERRQHEDIPHSRKTVFVDPGHAMQLSIQSDRFEYMPGEFVDLRIGVTDDTGSPLTAALLVNIVDEAMLSLAANDLSIDNIRLALSDIRFSEGLDAATLYTALIGEACEQTLTRILLRQGYTPLLTQSSHFFNFYLPLGGGYGTSRMFFTAITIYLLVMFTSLLVAIRPRRRRMSDMYASARTHPYETHAPGQNQIAGIHAPDTSHIPAAHPPDRSSAHPPNRYAAYTPNTPPPSLSKHSQRIIFLCVIAAIALFIFALLFLASCASGRNDADFAASEQAFEPAPAMDEAADMDMTADAPADMDAPQVQRPVDEIETQTARVRRLFLETMLFVPELIARDGYADLSFMLADNITTWNIQVVGNTQYGMVGHTEGHIRAFQPFFVNFELPRNSIRHDRVSIPVTVFNYTDHEQTVVLTIAELGWFTLHTDPVQTLVVPSNQSQMVYIPITITEFGDFVFRAYADTHDFADAAERSIRVNPEGFRINRVVYSGSVESSARHNIVFENANIADTRRVTVTLYPSAMAQLVEGMENIFRMPWGCFEQVSSILFPNILALYYMQENNIDNPELTATALRYISSGYQRILTYEVGRSGGFSLFGDPPAETVLTAYGLMQLKNLTRVYDIDERVLDRMLEYLFEGQHRNGEFDLRGLRTSRPSDSQVLMYNAYIAWAISEAFPNDHRLLDAIDFLASQLDQISDNFTLALLANALVNTSSPTASRVLGMLDGNVIISGDSAYITCSSRDYFGTRGHAQSLQTTALTSLAFSRQGVHHQSNALMMNFIIANRDSWGTWHSTQATILSLMALTNYATMAPLSDGQISVSLGDMDYTIDIVGENTLDLYQVVFTNVESESTLYINLHDVGRMVYKVMIEYYAPYDSIELNRGFHITSYMPTQLTVHELVLKEVRITNQSGYLVSNALATITIPQGFRVEVNSLAALKHRGVIDRYETRFDNINLYLRDVEPGQEIQMTIAYRPSYPVEITGGHMRVFDYYYPVVEGFLMPISIFVE